ncbi:MAG: DUF72 domain-containing protein [Candidatus Omnitrophica bacterium]|nr:DUF72 domain-containing protein [Candidatus Omnitrophota bacterium]
MRELFVGTSGWNYPHWADGVFYPQGLRQNNWLGYYAQHFNCVELNVTFYRTPEKKTFKNWYKKTPDDFCFVAKGSRLITHIKKLKQIKEPLNLFINNVISLKTKLAAILWQLPPSFKKDKKVLSTFLRLLKTSGIRQVFEFRNKSWFDEEVYALLKSYNASLCIAHSGDRFPCVKEVTADFIYLRFHGGESLYSSNYSDKELKEWVDFAKRFKDKDIFAFFNNDAFGYAVKNALRFRELLEK